MAVAERSPMLLGLALLLAPLAAGNGLAGLGAWEAPGRFVRVIRGTILLYVLVNTVAIASYVSW